ncbi:MAG TPA: hypothetical protein VEY92_10355, partial [Pseudoxanthomonas sp.]|nr:hypothetical protein [Pseudoxanthomonas sp.]
FARSTAPGAAFAMVVAGGLVGAVPAASAATVIGSGLLGGGIGKLGTSGLTAGGVSGSVAGGSLGVMFQNVTQSSTATGNMVGGMVGGLIGGLVGYALTWWYLTRFCQSVEDRRQVKRFMLLNSATGAAWVFVLMLSSLLVSRLSIVAVFVFGLAVINYQYLVTLPRIMDPMLAHPANARRRRGYQYFMGRTAMILSSLLATAALAWALVDGRA